MMAERFLEWLFYDYIPCLCNAIGNAVIKAFRMMVIVLLFPLWILPFACWYFFVRDDGKENEHDGE